MLVFPVLYNSTGSPNSSYTPYAGHSILDEGNQGLPRPVTSRYEQALNKSMYRGSNQLAATACSAYSWYCMEATETPPLQSSTGQ